MINHFYDMKWNLLRFVIVVVVVVLALNNPKKKINECHKKITGLVVTYSKFS